MGRDTSWRTLQGQSPRTETEWRRLAAEAHRLRGYPGDEAAALTHEHFILDIRAGLLPGSSNSRS